MAAKAVRLLEGSGLAPEVAVRCDGHDVRGAAVHKRTLWMRGGVRRGVRGAGRGRGLAEDGRGACRRGGRGSCGGVRPAVEALGGDACG